MNGPSPELFEAMAKDPEEATANYNRHVAQQMANMGY